jgi:hypothetical protein
VENKGARIGNASPNPTTRKIKIMSDETKLKKGDVERLYAEMSELEAWINPKPDPTEWPPKGWEYHPTAPGYLFRMVTESELREELFGSEEKTQWLKWAGQRVQEIKDSLASYFFPKQKEEGTERKEKSGFAAMLKTGLDRKFDLPVLASVVAECQRLANEGQLGINVEGRAIEWKPALKLKEYRELPEAIRTQFDAALIVTPKKPEFEIVKIDS